MKTALESKDSIGYDTHTIDQLRITNLVPRVMCSMYRTLKFWTGCRDFWRGIYKIILIELYFFAFTLRCFDKNLIHPHCSLSVISWSMLYIMSISESWPMRQETLVLATKWPHQTRKSIGTALERTMTPPHGTGFDETGTQSTQSCLTYPILWACCSRQSKLDWRCTHKWLSFSRGWGRFGWFSRRRRQRMRRMRKC